jgi:prepilin-type N-terminal cleavage/methylation domain-containing protein/prepilin-type processing-associated H-X9-DG protein
VPSRERGPTKSMRRRVAGFTLIELLVVIAIISILASILFPVFSRARAKARQAACISNQKQIILALKMYCEDFDEALPLGDYQPTDGSDGLFIDDYLQWYDMAFDYVRNSELYRCSEVRRLMPGYGMNAAAAGLSLGAFYDSSIKIITTDMQILGSTDPNPNLGEWRVAWNNGDLAAGNVHIDRHNNGAVYGFLDGHVKWHKPAAVKMQGATGKPLMWDPAEEPQD